MKPSDVQLWTHFKSEKEKRVFLVLEKPRTEDDYVVVMEVKFYPPGADRNFLRIHFHNWMEAVEVKKQLVEFIPRIF